jgi:RNA polymerase sigma-70 factor (ECF subfamily)
MLHEDATLQSQERSDEELLRASLSDPEEFVHLVRKYEAAFLRKARTVLYRQEDAEDVVQETFTKIYLHGPRFHAVPGASFKSWAYRILMNTAFTKYRKVMREQGKTADLEPEHYESLPDDVHEETFRLELSDYVVSIFARMPDHFVRVLTLHFIEGRPHSEIGEMEQISEGAVKTRVHRAKAYFREIAEQYSPY